MFIVLLQRERWKRKSWGKLSLYTFVEMLTDCPFSLQRFKLNIAHSVVTQQNSGLSSMDTDQVLDLFRRTTEEEDAAVAAKKAKLEFGNHLSSTSPDFWSRKWTPKCLSLSSRESLTVSQRRVVALPKLGRLAQWLKVSCSRVIN